MSRINTNVQSLIAQRVLAQNNQSLAVSLERLSTGYRVNRGKDDPAGLIVSENLRSEQKALGAAINNADRADQVANIAEGGLQEVSGMLTELQSLLTTSASRGGLSNEEKQANQLQIDSILQTIDRVASSTNFQGMKLLNGTLDFKTTGVASGVTDFRINASKNSSSSVQVDVQVTNSAQQGGVYLSLGGSAIDINSGASAFSIEIGGSKGSRELSFSSGTTLTKVASAINAFTDVTGVTATVSSTGIRLVSSDFGSSEFVSVKTVNSAGINSTNNGGGGAANRGIYQLQSANFSRSAAALTTTNSAGVAGSSFANATNGITDVGQNLGATINGVAATSTGKTARVSTDFLDVEITLNTGTSQTLGTVGGGSGAFTITGGGADFQLASKVDVGGKVSIGIQDVAARKLGNSSLGYLSSLASGRTNNVVDGDITQGQKIVGEAIKQVSSLRGRLGAFQKNTVGATIRSLGVAVENTAAAQSVVRDANFAEETASLTRSQILVSSAQNILSLANQAPQSALQLLG